MKKDDYNYLYGIMIEKVDKRYNEMITKSIVKFIIKNKELAKIRYVMKDLLGVGFRVLLDSELETLIPLRYNELSNDEKILLCEKLDCIAYSYNLAIGDE